MIAWCLCTPPLTAETFGGKVSASSVSRREIAGWKKKRRKNEKS